MTTHSAEPSASVTARDIVTDHLVAQVKRFPELTFDSPDVSRLSARDGALAGAIDHAVVKHWIMLRTLIESRLDREWDRVQPELAAVFLAAAGQMFVLDRVPDHAVVDSAVEWAKRRVRAKAGGFVNAVLRSLIRLRGDRIPPSARQEAIAESLNQNAFPLSDGSIQLLNENVFAENLAHRLAQQTSHALALIEQWINVFGWQEAQRLALHSVAEAPIVVTCDSSSAPMEGLRPHQSSGSFIFEGTIDQLRAATKTNAALRIQDAASAIPVELTRNLRPGVIFDACAGLGTKTRQLAVMHPTARIVATDVDARRRSALRQQFRGHSNVSVIEPEEQTQLNGSVDLLVLDVPCSNTGVLARRPEAKYRYSNETIDALVALQRQIVADAIPLRSERGAILYATCSIDPKENERQMEWLEKWHPLRRSSESRNRPVGGPGEDGAFYSDGGYAALVRSLDAR